MPMQKRIKTYWEGEASRYSEGIWKEMARYLEDRAEAERWGIHRQGC